jgi:hypothetical protein
MHGGSVYSALHNSRLQLSWPILLKQAMDAALGLRHLHYCGVVHGDVK